KPTLVVTRLNLCAWPTLSLRSCRNETFPKVGVKRRSIFLRIRWVEKVPSRRVPRAIFAPENAPEFKMHTRLSDMRCGSNARAATKDAHETLPVPSAKPGFRSRG